MKIYWCEYFGDYFFVQYGRDPQFFSEEENCWMVTHHFRFLKRFKLELVEVIKNGI